MEGRDELSALKTNPIMTSIPNVRIIYALKTQKNCGHDLLKELVKFHGWESLSLSVYDHAFCERGSVPGNLQWGVDSGLCQV